MQQNPALMSDQSQSGLLFKTQIMYHKKAK